MENRQQQQEQQEEQPRMNFLTMFMIFFLIRNIMSSFMGPQQQQTPSSVIEEYNQTYKASQPVQQATSANPVSSMFGIMKGMMPLNKGIKDATYLPTLHDNDLCVTILLGMLFSLSMCIFLKRMTIVLSTILICCTSANRSPTVPLWSTTR